MPLPSRRSFILALFSTVLIFIVFHTLFSDSEASYVPSFVSSRPKFDWKNVVQRYPVASLTQLPTGPPAPIPRIQHAFTEEKDLDRRERLERREAVLNSFVHSWVGYKKYAWLQDEVEPMTGGHKNGFGGWGATLVDSLDTLWIMGMKKEFAIAVNALKKIDFSESPITNINLFETVIRYLGGLLSAYDLSEQRYPILLKKATQLGDMLYMAFDTPNRMPIPHWNWRDAALGQEQVAPSSVLLAEYGSLSLEFTRLSQLTGDAKYYDAIQRITNIFQEKQNTTKIPGLWPMRINAEMLDFSLDRTYTMGAMADSHYEYLPKQHMMLGGRTDQYRDMYQAAISVAKEKMFFRPYNTDNQNILISGTLKGNAAGNVKLTPESQHLACFVGGMVGLAARIFEQEEDIETARRLVDGCLWAYDAMPSGIMPEIFSARPCTSEDCTWSETEWYQGVRKESNDHGGWSLPLDEHARGIIKRKKLVPGFTDIADSRFLLRPEAIESVFILYRITGDKTLQDRAWKMFQAIEKHAKTEIAYASIHDVSVAETQQIDSMESFWTAETLKYFYLIFSEPELVSLDEYVLNTEAHPLLREKIPVSS